MCVCVCVPVVYRLAVALLEDDLGREILWCTAEGPRAVLDVLGEAKVGQFERAILGDKDVLELEVTMDDRHRM